MTNTLVSKVLAQIDYASWVVQHHAQDWQMGITQRYYVHVAADRAWRFADRLASVTEAVAVRAHHLSNRAYDGWVLSGRAWERHLDRTIGREDSGRFFLAPADRAPRTIAEIAAAEDAD